MKRKIKNKNKSLKRFNKKLLILLLLLILFVIIILIIVNRKEIKDFLIPIYNVEDRTKDVEKYKKKKNSNVIGWVKVQGTNIDMPITSTVETGLENFAWINEYNGKFQDYIPIFGHNFRNVGYRPIVGDNKMQRFEQLLSFVYSDFANKNKYFQVTINGKNYLYQIYAVSFVYENGLNYKYEKLPSDVKKEYIDNALKESIYKYDVDVTKNDSLAALYTCTRLIGPNHSYLKVDGKLVKNSNKGYNYDMHEKKGYKKIKKLLEGDGEDV